MHKHDTYGVGAGLTLACATRRLDSGGTLRLGRTDDSDGIGSEILGLGRTGDSDGIGSEILGR